MGGFSDGKTLSLEHSAFGYKPTSALCDAPSRSKVPPPVKQKATQVNQECRRQKKGADPVEGQVSGCGCQPQGAEEEARTPGAHPHPGKTRRPTVTQQTVTYSPWLPLQPPGPRPSPCTMAGRGLRCCSAVQAPGPECQTGAGRRGPGPMGPAARLGAACKCCCSLARAESRQPAVLTVMTLLVAVLP